MVGRGDTASRYTVVTTRTNFVLGVLSKPDAACPAVLATPCGKSRIKLGMTACRRCNDAIQTITATVADVMTTGLTC